jgi:hypothetical protein
VNLVVSKSALKGCSGNKVRQYQGRQSHMQIWTSRMHPSHLDVGTNTDCCPQWLLFPAVCQLSGR